jgi:hypothetical protein
LQNTAAASDAWYPDAAGHYREVAQWLRGVAARCRLPNPQRELLTLARKYERRAHRFDTGWRYCPMIGEVPEWTLYALPALAILIMLLPLLKR